MPPQAPGGAGYREEALRIACAAGLLQAVLARPAQPSPTGVLIVVGGPQYRAGSHRQYVLLARALARAGHAVLRYDCPGRGDSPGAPPDFEKDFEDIPAALAALLHAVPALRQVALWGLCDAASAILLYCQATRDPRIAALALANPWMRSAQSLAQVQQRHYYFQRLQAPGF